MEDQQENIAPNEPSQKDGTPPVDSECDDEKEKVVWDRIDKLLSEYYLNEFQRLAVHKFIKVKISNTENDE